MVVPTTVNAGIPVAIVAFFVLWAVLGAAGFGVWLWGLIDAARRPEWAYAVSESSKTFWIVLIAVLGAIPAIIYLSAIRPRVRAAEDAVSRGQAPTPASSVGAQDPQRFCTRCGAGQPDGARFCWRCGVAR